MKLALAVFEERISVIFDNSSQLLLVSIKDDLVTSTRKINYGALCTVEMIEILKDEWVKILICGAISDFMQQTIERNGIKVIPWISGSVQKVLDAWLSGTMEELVMPGCCRSNAKKYGKDQFVKNV